MMRLVILLAFFAASIDAANAQDAPGTSEAGGAVRPRGLLALPCSHRRAGFAATYRCRTGFPDNRQHIRDDGDRPPFAPFCSRRIRRCQTDRSNRPTVIAFLLSLRDRAQSKSRP